MVEDHEDTMAVTCHLLESRGYQIIRATNVAGAIAVGRTTDFDILLADIHLPDGKGWDVIGALRPIKTFKSISITADCMEPSQAKQREKGFDACVAKPFRIASLVEQIQAIST